MIDRVLIIAEAGVNHNGNLSLAKELIDAAATAGADVVKFQTFRASEMVTKAASKAAYQVKEDDSKESQHEMLKKLELSKASHFELMKHCKDRDIKFLSSAFDIPSIDFLVSLGQDCFKIPSGEITNLPYLRHIGRLGREIILSSGMSTMKEVEEAIYALEFAGTPRNLITVMHCTTEYPAPINEVNLNAMLTIKNALGVAIGYSDHTQGFEVSIAAVAMGAKVIEKHFTMSRNSPGPDHKASLEPFELKQMIASIRNVELALGNGIKCPSPSEISNIKVARKSIVAKVPINSGELMTAENLTTRRPGIGISPMRWVEVLGKIAPRDFLADELIDI